jgi:hypothetical protein
MATHSHCAGLGNTPCARPERCGSLAREVVTWCTWWSPSVKCSDSAAKYALVVKAYWARLIVSILRAQRGCAVDLDVPATAHYLRQRNTDVAVSMNAVCGYYECRYLAARGINRAG